MTINTEPEKSDRSAHVGGSANGSVVNTGTISDSEINITYENIGQIRTKNIHIYGDFGKLLGDITGIRETASSKTKVDELLKKAVLIYTEAIESLYEGGERILGEMKKWAQQNYTELVRRWNEVGSTGLTADVFLFEAWLQHEHPELVKEWEKEHLSGVKPEMFITNRLAKGPELIEKIQEELTLLQEANKIDPTNIDVLLQMAKAYAVVTPNDASDEIRILRRVLSLLSVPKDDKERFQCAQANAALAMYSDPPDVDRLTTARRIFAALGRTEFLQEIDEILAKVKSRSLSDQQIRSSAIFSRDNRTGYSGDTGALTSGQRIPLPSERTGINPQDHFARPFEHPQQERIRNPGGPLCGGWARSDGLLIPVSGETILAVLPQMNLFLFLSANNSWVPASQGGKLIVTNKRIAYLNSSSMLRERDTYLIIIKGDWLEFNINPPSPHIIYMPKDLSQLQIVDIYGNNYANTFLGGRLIIGFQDFFGRFPFSDDFIRLLTDFRNEGLQWKNDAK